MGSADYRMVAWVYGALPPLDWDEDCEREAAVDQRRLWNRLVEVETARQAGEQQIYRRDPELAAIEERLAAIAIRLEAIPRRAASAAEQAERWALRTEQRGLWARAKPLREQMRRAHAADFSALRHLRYAAITAARQQSGLWWGNYNAVCAAFDVALGRLGPGEMIRAKPDPANGDARLTNQIQHGIPAPVWLASGHAQLRLEEMPSQHPLRARGAGRAGRLRLCRLTVHSHGRGTRKTVALPLVWHRDLPAGARIMTVIVQRRRLTVPPIVTRPRPDHDRWQVIFVCRTPLPAAAAAAGEQAGIDIGWRIVDGGLRVATIAGSTGALDHIVLPQAWIDRMIALAARIGEARKAFDAGDIGTAARLRHVIGHTRDKTLHARREYYRVAAKNIAGRYSLIAIDAALEPVTRRREAGHRELPPMARRMRTWAAPHELAAEIARAIAARGGRIEYATGPTTLVCHRCGHHNNFSDFARQDLIQICTGCHRFWDQDENAARLLCAAAGGGAGGGAIALATKDNRGLKRARLTRKSTARKASDNPLPLG